MPRAAAPKSRVVEVRPASAGEWDAAWSRCGHATYFHSRVWAECWLTYSNRRTGPAPLMVRFADGRRVVLPMSRERDRWGRTLRYVMSPAGTYGGWLTDEPIDGDQVDALVSLLQRSRVPVWWRVNPYDPHATTLALCAHEPDVTHAFPLSGGYEGACSRASRSHAQGIRKAKREGLYVRCAHGPADWDAYYAAYTSSLARWGRRASSRYGARLFDALRRRGAGGVRLWLACRDDGAVIAGDLCVYASRHAAIWHAASLSEYMNLRPQNLLVDEILKDACSRSMTWLDMNPSGGHEGVRTFKERVGASAMLAPIILCGGLPKARGGRTLHGRWKPDR